MPLLTIPVKANGDAVTFTEFNSIVTAVNGLDVNKATVTLVGTKVDKITGMGLSANDFTTVEKNKLAGIATGATANATDAQLRDRSTHTGNLAIAVTTGLQTALDGKAAASHTHAIADVVGLTTALAGKQNTLTAGTNISIVNNVISASGSSTPAVTLGVNVDTYQFSVGNLLHKVVIITPTAIVLSIDTTDGGTDVMDDATLAAGSATVLDISKYYQATGSLYFNGILSDTIIKLYIL